MGFDYNNDRRQEIVYSQKIKAGKRRTYFIDVRQTRANDYCISITESTKRFEDDSFMRHKIFLYKEDFNRFMEGLNQAIQHVKTELMPDYDYDEFARRYEEQEGEGEDFERPVSERPLERPSYHNRPANQPQQGFRKPRYEQQGPPPRPFKAEEKEEIDGDVEGW